MERITHLFSRITRTAIMGFILLPLLLSLGCTARYSQAISGSIPKEPGTEISTSATGLSVFAIAFTEPTPAHEQVMSLLGGCSSLTNVEIDYRETVFFIVGIPKVSVKANCIR